MTETYIVLYSLCGVVKRKEEGRGKVLDKVVVGKTPLKISIKIPSTTDEGAFIDDAQLLAPDFIDLEARNGVIHVIDSVLGVPSMMASAQAVPEPTSFTLVLLGFMSCVGLRRKSRFNVG